MKCHGPSVLAGMGQWCEGVRDGFAQNWVNDGVEDTMIAPLKILQESSVDAIVIHETNEVLGGDSDLIESCLVPVCE